MKSAIYLRPYCQMNHTLAFYYYAEKLPAAAMLEIAASNVYRLFLNGDLKGYGPARAAHGYTRKDVYDLSDHEGKSLHIVIEVFAANINSYYIINELPFFAAVLTTGEMQIAGSENFRAFELTDRVSKVQRFSFQRTFAESYRMDACRSKFYNGDLSVFPEVETVPVEANILIDRNIPYPRLERIRNIGLTETGRVETDPGKKIWQDRAIYNISDKLLGYRYEELEDYLSDDASKFVFESDQVFSGDTVDTSDDGDISAGHYKTYRFDRTITGFFSLKVSAGSSGTGSGSAVIYIIWDEIMAKRDGPSLHDESAKKVRPSLHFERNGTCNVLKYTLAPGEYDLLSFEPVSAQFVRIIVTEGEIVLKDLAMVTYENSAVKDFKFSNADKELEAIVDAAKNTFAQNAVDVLTDCPSRERAGWLCDSYFSGRAEKVFTGRNDVERNFLENYMMAPQLKELPQGMIPMCYPADHYDGVYIPNWSMWYVLELLNYYRNTGDKDMVEGSRTKVYGLVEFFRKYLNEDGLLEDLENWVFIEWSKCNDADHIKGVNYPSNMLYSAMLEAVDELYRDEALRDQCRAIRAKIIEQAYNGEFFEDNSVRVDGVLTLQGHLTETCQYYAFYFGVASREAFPELFDRMVNEFGPSRDDTRVYPHIARSNAIVGNYLRLEILLRYGYSEKVIEECKKFFAKMAEATGTLWEHDFVSGSLNHGFASIAAGYIVEAETVAKTMTGAV